MIEAPVYRRPELAGRIAQQLLQPSVLDEGLRSGLFLSGLRRTGKTTFVQSDLIPALEAAGALVIYVDLWSDVQTSPAVLIHQAIRSTLSALRAPGSSLLERLASVEGISIGPVGLEFDFEPDSVGREAGPTLARALTGLVDRARTDVVFIVDEVQQAITSEEGNRTLLELKAARDAVNLRPGTPGHFLFVGTGSHRALVAELTARRNQAFAGARSVAYPVLAGDYVDHLLARLRTDEGDDADGPSARVSRDVVVAAFETLGNRPEELLRALRLLQRQLPDGGDPDEHLPVIAAALRTSAVDVELAKVQELGALAQAIFERIAANESGGRGLYSGAAAAEFSARLGRAVRGEEIQPLVNELMDANVIMRRGHGHYEITDPFVQRIWREREALLYRVSDEPPDASSDP